MDGQMDGMLYALCQGSAKSGPRAKSGPQALSIRPTAVRQLKHYDRPTLSPVEWTMACTHNQWPCLSKQGTAI